MQNVLSVDQLPVVPNPALTRHEFEAWPHLQDLDLPAAHGEVLLLIGLDTPEAFWVKEERRGSAKEPYAVRGVLGWSVVGPRTTAQGNLSEGDDSISVNFLNTSDDLLDSQIQCLWRLYYKIGLKIKQKNQSSRTYFKTYIQPSISETLVAELTNGSIFGGDEESAQRRLYHLPHQVGFEPLFLFAPKWKTLLHVNT